MLGETDKISTYGVLAFFGIIILVTLGLIGGLIIYYIKQKISRIKYNNRRKRFKVVK